jgi:nucleotide-binding universal stress UspA family protein
MIGRIALDLQKDTNFQRRLKTGIQLAKKHQAELVGVYTTRLQQPYIFDDVSVPSQVRTIMGTYLHEEKEEMQGIFLESTAEAGVKAQWRAPEGPPEEALIMQARYCDLIIMSQTENRQSVGNMLPNHTEAVIMSAGRPVLMVPYAGDVLPDLGKRVLICWDYGRRAARALADAGPLLERATDIVVLTIDPDASMLRSRGIEPEDLLSYFKAHRYADVREVFKHSADNDIGNTILNTATDYGCDLIVMGAYNRNRMREWAFGGTSKTLLQSMTVPILFSH